MLRAVAVGLIVVAAGLAAPIAGQSAERPRVRALLVGIAHYPDATGWPQLQGPPHDVERLAACLAERAPVRTEDLRVLIDAQATRQAIVDTFLELAAASAPDDVLLFFFAGHGSQLPDLDGDEPDGMDETLIPYDATQPDGTPGDLLDDDLRALIVQANRFTRHVVLIVDACSSGTITRAADEPVRRFVGPGRRGLAGTRPALARTAPDGGSGWTLGDAGYVALSACRSSESAYEYEAAAPGEAPVAHGLFTFVLLQELERLSPRSSYADLVDAVRWRVQALQPGQTPVIEGPLARECVLSGELSAESPAIMARTANGRVVVEAGRVNGLWPGALLAVRDELGAPRLRLAEVGAVRSDGDWLPGAPPATSGPWPCVVVDPGQDPWRPSIAIDDRPDAPEDAVIPLYRLLLQRPAWRLAEVGGADVVCRLDHEQPPRWRAMACVGQSVERAWPLDAAVGDPAGLQAWLERLDACAAALRLRRSLCSDSGEGLAVEVALQPVGADGRPLGELPRDDAGVPTLHRGDRVIARLTNRSAAPLHVSLIVISPDGAIDVLPLTADAGAALAPGATASSPRLELTVPPGAEAFYATGPQCFRWLATAQPHDVAGLAQPAATAVALRGASPGAPVELQRSEAWLTRTIDVHIEVGEPATGGVQAAAAAHD